MLLRTEGLAGGLTRRIMPGDIIAGGELLAPGALTTVGAGTWLAAQIATGIITRTGPTGAYTDTTDTAANILAALSGNNVYTDVDIGNTFRMLGINTVAFLGTVAAGRGVTLDNTNGTAVTNLTASLVREYLWTVLNATPEITLPCFFTTGTKVVNFLLPNGAVSLPMVGSNGQIGTGPVTPGQVLTGTGITAGTKVLGLIQGQGGVIGVTTDTNTASTQTLSSITFSPNLLLSSLGTRGL